MASPFLGFKAVPLLLVIAFHSADHSQKKSDSSVLTTCEQFCVQYPVFGFQIIVPREPTVSPSSVH